MCARPFAAGDERDPHGQPAYRTVPADQLPLGESLKDTIARTVPYFKEIAPACARASRC